MARLGGFEGKKIIEKGLAPNLVKALFNLIM
jgi:hypothetical protein